MATIREKIRRVFRSTPAGLLINLFWIYAAYTICRAAFLLENWSVFSDSLTWKSAFTMFIGGLRFDSSAIFYSNALFILLYLLPVAAKEGKKWYKATTKWIYVAVNALCVVINLADTVFFAFRLQRSTMATFTEFQGEGNLLKIGAIELLSHWYFVLLAAAITYGFIRLYRYPAMPGKPRRNYYITNCVALVVMGYLTVSGMRGALLFLSATRPISVGYAQRYVGRAVETGVVLNTPFSLLRTTGQHVMAEPTFFSDKELDAIYSPLHIPADTVAPRGKNVVILIVESLSQEFIGALNKDLDGGKYKGYTPFTDSLLNVSAYWEQSFANTYFSIDAPPAVLASIPRMRTPFMTSSHSLNDINSIASELKPLGYRSAFFHGADNESLGIHAFTNQAGFDSYFGQNEFYADKRFGGKSQFDGTWGVWDEPFLQFFAAKIGEMPQPFVASVFTLSSHHPFRVPEQYKDSLKDEGLFPLHKCIRYADLSLRRFFETASRQPWYSNTIFILTADHTSAKRTHDVYKTDLGGFRVPILIFDPSGELPRGRMEGIAQQTDIMPTMLNYLGAKRPYIAFGKDLFATPAEDSWAFNWDKIPQYIQGDWLLQLDGEEGNVTALYNYKRDPLLKNNLAGKGIAEEAAMTRKARAFIQSYLKRMSNNSATVNPTKKPQ